MFTFNRTNKSPTPNKPSKPVDQPKSPRPSEAVKLPPELLKESDIVQILELEERMNSGTSTLADTEAVVLLYAKVVEYCDTIRADPLRTYFMEKLIILSHGVAKKGRDKQKALNENPAQVVADILVDPTRPRTMKQMAPNPNPEKTMPIVQERVSTAVIDLQEKNLKEYREKKQKQWNFEQLIDKDLTTQQHESLTNLMKQKDLQRNNDRLIKDSLNSQQEALQERLRQRREKSFTKTLNKEDNSMVKPSLKVNEQSGETAATQEKSVLQDLEDGLTQEEISQNILKLLDKYQAPDRRGGND